jgi:hypothetical protein
MTDESEERRMPGSNNEHDELPLAHRRAADIANQFPDHLDDSEVRQVAQRIERHFASIDELRRYPLANSDEPAPVFRAIGKEQQ